MTARSGTAIARALWHALLAASVSASVAVASVQQSPPSQSPPQGQQPATQEPVQQPPVKQPGAQEPSVVPQAPPTPIVRKSDVVVLKNGDRMTGEIKELLRGKLELSTNSLDTAYVEWADIARVSSYFRYRIELTYGAFYLGTLQAPKRDGFLLIDEGGEPVEIAMDRVVWITQIGEGLENRLSGYINTGFSYTKASDVTQFTFGGNLHYDAEDYALDLQVDLITTDESSSSTERLDSTFTYTRYLGDNWFAAAGVGYEQNDEIGVDDRSSVTGLGGKFLVRNNQMQWGVGAGLRGNLENAGQADELYSLEGVLGTDFRYFIYNTPKSDIRLRVDVYPSLTESGRWRVDVNAKFRQELVEDFFIDVSFYGNYDTDPPTLGADNSDYGVVMSLGYSF
jgi:hypothetical protein